MHVAHRRGSILFRRGGAIPWGDGEGAILGIFSIDNALCIIAFGTHTKTAELIEMPFGLVTLVNPGYHVLDGDPIT